MTNIQPKAKTAVRSDPIRPRYYRPIEIAEEVRGWLFYVGAVAMLATVAFGGGQWTLAYSFAQVAAVVLALAMFGVGLITQLYLVPRAEDARRSEFLSNAFDFNLTHERTFGYYNNRETEPLVRIAMSALENVFFSKTLLLHMLRRERVRVAGFVLMWAVLALWREVSLDWIAVAAQVLFGEEIMARWLRMEWLRVRHERTYDSLYLVIQAKPDATRIGPIALEAYGEYEAGKAAAGVVLTHSLFEKLNPSLSAEWTTIRAGLSH